MNRYIIYCCAGSGGLFLTSVFAKIMGIAIAPTFSNTGNCHDLGHGVWKDVPGANIVGDHWELNYQASCPLYYAHRLLPTFRNDNPDVKFVLIDVDPEDYRIVTTLVVKKAWPDIWTLEEYDKWKGPNYPPYSNNNIAESELIVQDLVDDLAITSTQAWIDRNAHEHCDYRINFKTIFGLNNLTLDQVVADIVQKPTTRQIHQYVVDYQQLNRRLYFND